MHYGENLTEITCRVCRCAESTDGVQMVLHRMVEGHICENCDMELGVEFYDDQSRYFEMAAQATGLEILECKKRYLEEIVSRIQKLLSCNAPDLNVEHREWSLEHCQEQIQAISEYQEKFQSGPSKAGLARRRMEKAMQTKAFGLNLVIPGLIEIEIE